MKQFLGASALVVCFLGSLCIAGCVQMPTEKHGVADIRPQISFKISSESTQNAKVMIDGLEMGLVGEYLDGIASLRILPGTHLLVVTLGNQRLLDEKFYAGDGVNRTFNLK